ncbi:MAG: hypothetical protein JWP18_356, partial [Solirubrobacterales bacterium]|nr:hypothetical protein [Solirubrobacterales bacterium]
LDRPGRRNFDQTNTLKGTLRRVHSPAYQGQGSAHAVTRGGGDAYSRGLFEVSWHEGADVWFGAAFLLPRSFGADMQGEVDLLRWDNFPDDRVTTDRSGVVIFQGDRRAHLIRQRLRVEDVPLGRSFTLPVGRWFWLEVHQRLSRDMGALSEVFLDGRRVTVSRAANSYGRTVRRIRFGIVAVDADRQSSPLELWFDRVAVGTRPRGPVNRVRR